MAKYLAIALDPVTHDVFLDENGGLAVVENSGAVAQRVKERLLFWQGEWWLDRSAGVPWLQSVFVEPFDQPMAEAIIKAEIVNTPGVKEILTFFATFDRQTRGLKSHDISILTDFDEVVDI